MNSDEEMIGCAKKLTICGCTHCCYLNSKSINNIIIAKLHVSHPSGRNYTIPVL